jgi:hypothetical protein
LVLITPLLPNVRLQFVGLCSEVVEILYLRQLMEELGKPHSQQEGTVLVRTTRIASFWPKEKLPVEAGAST